MRRLMCIIICAVLCAWGPGQGTRAGSSARAEPITQEERAAAPAAYAVVRYELSADERQIVEQVVMAEAGAEPYAGQLAVAQCILNACELEDKRPGEIVVDYRYTQRRPAPTDEVKAAVSAVFDSGVTVADRQILYFYAPAMVESPWHESQEYVMTIGGHRFFGEG